MLSTRGQLIALLVEDVVAEPPSPNQSIDVDPASFVDPPTANGILFGTPSGPITPSNVDSGQSLAVTVTSIQSGTGSNIQGFLGGSSVAINYSGLWKFTAKIKAGDRGKSSSIVWSGSKVFGDAKATALAWIDYLSNTFGSAAALGVLDSSYSAGSPGVKTLRIQDALNPRLGGLVKGPFSFEAFGKGTGAGDASTADFLSTALSLRLTCVTNEPAPVGPNINQVVYANHALYGIPDDVVIEGDQIDTSLPVGGFTWSYYAALYIAWITNPANFLGCITTRASETVFQAGNFTRPNPGDWQCVTTKPHGYNSGDRVRLTKCNAPFFAGSYIVNVIDAVTISLVNGPPRGIAAPTFANVRRAWIPRASAWECLRRRPCPMGSRATRGT